MDERIKIYDEKMTKTYNNLLGEFATIRAGRANPNILNKLKVDYYGTPTPLQQIGNITVPEPRILQIQPWEASMVKAIEKAILTSDIGINPSNDGRVIRLVFPELTEERRKDLVKEVKKKGEAGKVALRNIRRDANDYLKKLGISAEVAQCNIRRDANDYLKKLGKTEVSEDEIKDLEDSVQKLTDKYIKEVDKAIEEKSKEILTV